MVGGWGDKNELFVEFVEALASAAAFGYRRVALGACVVEPVRGPFSATVFRPRRRFVWAGTSWNRGIAGRLGLGCETDDSVPGDAPRPRE